MNLTGIGEPSVIEEKRKLMNLSGILTRISDTSTSQATNDCKSKPTINRSHLRAIAAKVTERVLSAASRPSDIFVISV